MSKNSVHQCRGFQSDRRMSMDIYAESIAKVADNERFSVDVTRPQSSLERYSMNRLVMRYLRYWHYPRIMKSIESDLYHVLDHGYAHLQPKLKVGNAHSKACITVHDLIPMLTWYGQIQSADGSKIPSRKPWLNIKSLSYLAHFDRIIAVSASTKNDLLSHFKLAPEKVEVIPPIIDQVFRPSTEFEKSAFSTKYGFDRDCKWVMVSGSEFYKNHRTSLKVLAELNRQHDIEFRLVKTGLMSEDFNLMVQEFGLESRVKSIFLEEAFDLAHLYSLVDCLLFPSLYEGFGMPVAEALACGTPVVISDRGSLPEVGGPLAAVCDAGNVQSLCQEVTSMVFDDQRRQTISQRGPEWVDQFRAEALGPKLNEFYRSTLDC